MKAKYKHVRTYYVKERKKVIEASRSGAGTNEAYIPKWLHYKDLEFLASTIEQRATESSIIASTPVTSPCSPDTLDMEVS